MNTKKIVIYSVLVACIGLFGCATSGMFTGGNITNVELQKSNYKIIAHNVSGESSAGYILGISVSSGMATSTLAMVRVNGSGMLYKDATEDLWKNFEAKYGAVDGRKLALVNLRYDGDALNLFVYTKPKVMIRADVVEFVE